MFYKDKNFVFSLKDLNVVEEFTIWAGWKVDPTTLKDPDGNPYKFPIREGMLKGTDGKVRSLEQLKYMKRADFNTLYPGLGKSTKFIRSIIVGGQEFEYRFSMTSNNKLLGLIQTVQQLGNDPLTTSFQQTYDRNKQPAQKYSINLVGQVKKGNVNVMPTTKVETQNITPNTGLEIVQDNNPKVPIVETKGDGSMFTESERKIYDALLAKSEVVPEDKFYDVFKTNMEKWGKSYIRDRVTRFYKLYIEHKAKK